MKKCIILANGKPPLKSLITFLKGKGFSTLICADGGANSARKLNLIPDYIIGDLDSITPNTVEFFSTRCEIIRITRQNDTDVEKCIKFACKNGFEEAVLLGATGDRLDHSFCNLGILLKFFAKLKIQIIHEKSILSPIKGNVALETVPGEIISLYGFDKKTRISSKGLKYTLKNITLPFGEKDSTSNVALSSKLNLSVKGGVVFIIRNVEIMRKNGLI